MTMEEIFKTMQDLIAEQFAIDTDEISMESSFVDDLGADSVDLVELVMAMEEEFDIGEIDEEDLAGLKTDSMMELNYVQRKRVHNLKYYTWVEQQQMNVEDLNAQWYDTKNTWDAVHAQAKELDELINEFNEATGLLKAL